MGSPAGGRKELRDTLDFSAHQNVVPEVTTYPLEKAADVFDALRNGTMRGRAVLVP